MCLIRTYVGSFIRVVEADCSSYALAAAGDDDNFTVVLLAALNRESRHSGPSQ
jgi:hypothetical protein